MIDKNLTKYTQLLIASLFFGVTADASDIFVPGQKWQDNNGIHINAHGGGIINYGGEYYWFGEDKGNPPDGNLAKTGVHVYSSEDLYYWHDDGLALKVSGDASSDIASGGIIERPKVIYNDKTHKFIMWFHLELKGQGYGAARVGVAESDSITGPFTFINSFRPDAGAWPVNVDPSDKTPGNGNILARDFEGGQMARDMNIYKDNDGKAYLIYVSEENKTLHISELSDDYTHTIGHYSRIFPGARNEAPAIFRHNGYYYMITSGQSGWAPNAARSFMAKNILGPWVSLGNPVRGSKIDMSKTFFSQSTFIVPVPGEQDKFIFMGDRWTPKNPIDGRYVWLPLKWDGDRPVIYWSDQWRYQDAFTDVTTFRRDGGDFKWTAASGSRNWTNPFTNTAMSWPQGGFAVFDGPAKKVTVVNSTDSSGKPATGVYFSGGWFASDGYLITGDSLAAVSTTAGLHWADQVPGTGEFYIRVGSDEKGPFTATIDSDIRESDTQDSLTLVKTDLGRLILNGTNTYKGGTRIVGGILQVSADNNLGAATGALTLDGGELALGGSFDPAVTRPVTLGTVGGGIDTSGFNMKISQQITGQGKLFKLGNGTLTLDGKNSYAGGTEINGGTLAAKGGNAIPDTGELIIGPHGRLALLSPETVDTLSGDGVINLGASALTLETAGLSGYYAGLITGTGGVIKSGNGTQTLAGENDFTGGLTLENGRLLVMRDVSLGGSASPLTFNGGTLVSVDDLRLSQTRPVIIAEKGGSIDTGGHEMIIEQNISGSGSLSKQGEGTLILSGNNTWAGNTTVTTGRLAVNGSVTSDVIVQDKGVLSGNGRTGAITVRQGGTAAPGNSVGTLTASGNITFEPGSHYAVEISRAGRGDLLATTGRARLNGGEVAVLVENSTNLLSQEQILSMVGRTFIVLDAAQGVSGHFDSVSPDYLFLGTGLSYGEKKMTLKTGRNSTPFTSAARTPNQRAVAAALDTLPAGQPVRESVLLSTTPEQAAAAFRALTGQVHADVSRALTQESWLVRDTLNARMAQLNSNSGYPEIRYDDNGTWARLLGNWERAKGENGDAGFHDAVYGVMFGADADVPGGATLGMAGGYSRTSLNSGYNGSGDVDSWHLAGYGSGPAGPLVLRSGADMAWHRIDTDRHVAYDNQHGTNSAHYSARSGQIFADAGYDLLAGPSRLEPYAGMSFTTLGRDAFSESGGAAALRGGKDETHTLLSETGLRGVKEWAVSQAVTLGLQAGAGWQHRLSAADKGTGLRFGSGSTFTTNSAGDDRNALVFKAGLRLQAGSDLAVNLNYGGQLSGNRQSNSAGADIRWSF